MSNFLAVLALIAGVWLVSSWTLMLLFGIVHLHVWAPVPPIGFGVAMAISTVMVGRTILVGVLSGLAKSLGEDKA